MTYKREYALEYEKDVARSLATRTDTWYVLVLLVQEAPVAVFLASTSWVWRRIGKGRGDWGALSVLAVDDVRGRTDPPFVRKVWPAWNHGEVC